MKKQNCVDFSLDFLTKYLKYSLNIAKQTSQKKIDRFHEVLQICVVNSVSLHL